MTKLGWFIVSLFGACTTCVTLIACGGGNDGSSSTAADPQTSAPSGQLGGGADGGLSTSTLPSELDACATSSAEAEKKPLYLVFMFDRSLSMFGAKLSNRWGPCKAATKSFFAEADKGISASLQYVPLPGTLSSCDSAPYATPAVAMTALPNDALEKSLDSQLPEFGTPLQPAMAGAVAYAQQIAAGDDGKNGKVAVVLVSDGEPVGCGSSVPETAKIAAAVAATIPTYVIGIGDGAALNDIATAGGTKQAILVSDANAAETETSFRQALDGIRSSAVACEYTIPSPPNGETFDRGKVNIVHKPESGSPVTVLYDPSCVGPGWRYDDPNNPTHVVLCAQSCTELEAKAGKVDVLFGCTTRSAPVK